MQDPRDAADAGPVRYVEPAQPQPLPQPPQASAPAPWDIPGRPDGSPQYGRYGTTPRASPRRTSHRLKRRRPLRRVAVVVLAVLLAIPVGTFGWADTKLNRDVDLAAVGGHIPAGKGTNYLIVGSDSREGLTDRDKKDLHTGSAGGRRTDSMILMHTGAEGTTMVSLPRDSWVTVPRYHSPRTGKWRGPAKNKLNAAFSIGGPKMLVHTVEQNTGLRIDHYAEVGFAGFVNVVNAVGGVRMCVDHDIHDEKSGLDLTKGCHVLRGKEALAFVRQRHQEKEGDIGRSRNQQKFLSALAHRAAAPDNLANPFTLFPTVDAGLETVVVDDGTGLRDLTSLFRALKTASRSQRSQVKIPLGAVGFHTSKGSAIGWDWPKARKLFAQLREDRPVTIGVGGAGKRG